MFFLALAAAVGWQAPQQPSLLRAAGGPAAQSPSLLRAPTGWTPTPAMPPVARGGSASMMPIGVPKVAYRVPGATSADWVDIYDRLYRERIIFLGQEIDDEICNQIIAVMLFSDSEEEDEFR